MIGFVNRSLVILTGLLLLPAVSGCTAFGGWGAATHSYDLKGEQIIVDLMKTDELNAYILDLNNINKEHTIEIPAAIFEPSKQGGTHNFAESAAGVAADLVGAAIDIVKAEIEADAARHARSFAGSTFVPGLIDPENTKLQYACIRIRRFTDKFPQDESNPNGVTSNKLPAFELLLYIDQSNPDFYILEPIYLKINSSGAKLSSNDVKLSVQLTEHATWLASSPDQKSSGSSDTQPTTKASSAGDLLNDKDIITSTWDASTRKLGQIYVFHAPKQQTFVKPFVRVPVGLTNKKPAGLCTISVVVSESDPTDVAANEKYVATFLGTNKSDIIKAFGLNSPTSQPSATQPSKPKGSSDTSEQKPK